MRVSVLAVGKPRQGSGGIADAIDDYERRAARYWPMDVITVREESARSLPADQVRDREAERLLARLPSPARLVLCDPEGQGMTSMAFATFLIGVRDRGENIAFLIGGPFGLGTALRTRADKLLLLAPWTLPHDLARLVLAEQLYRAGTIMRGEPYHK